jgi:CDP-glucose 4,6-dehydratase
MKKTINIKYWKNKKVFVTGHTGFKGSWLCLFLSYLGAEVTGYSLKPNTKPSLFVLAKIGKIIKKSIIADVRNYKKLENEIKKSKATILFHLAAQPLVRYSYLNPKETFDTNFSGSLNVLECIKKSKRIKTGIIITTDKVYDITNNKIFKETDKLGGLDPYSSSKVCVEFLFNSYLKSFFKAGQKMLATVRAGNVIGGGDYSLDRLVPDIYKSMKKEKKIILRNPQAVRPWQHVLEPLSGYLMLAQNIHDKKIKKVNQNWNFAPNISSCKSVLYLSKYFSKQLKLNIVINKKDSKQIFKPETSILRLSNYKSRNLLKWHPKWSINKSLDKIIEWNMKVKKNKHADVCFQQIKDYIKD